MAALRVKRYWWTRQDHPAAPEAPLFRVLARRWRPVVRIESKAVPMQLALHTSERAPAGRASFGPSRPIYAPEKPKPAPIWNPWLWTR